METMIFIQRKRKEKKTWHAKRQKKPRVYRATDGSKIDSFQNANFLISQPNPMMIHSLESSLQDDFNEGHIIGFG